MSGPRRGLAPTLWLAALVLTSGLAAQPTPPLLGPRELLLVREDGGRVPLAPLLFRQAFLGLEAVDVTPELRRHLGGPADRGVLVAALATGSPAAGAEARVGDLLLAIDGEPIRSAWELDREVGERAAGDRLELEIWRAGEVHHLEVALAAGERPTFDVGPFVWRLRDGRAPQRLRLLRPGHRDELVVDGARVNELAERLADRLDTPAWQARLGRGELEQRIVELEARLAQLEEELVRLRRDE